jgi:very-short-patch-repair endonuclease
LVSAARRALGGFTFRRQHPIGPFIADFACIEAKLAVEVDGGQHFTDEAEKYDRSRDEFLRTEGWRIARVTTTDVFKHLDNVLEHIAEMLLPPPPRSPKARSAPPP